jgi:hypothetical protein
MYEQLREEIVEEFDRYAVEQGHRAGHRWPWTLDKLMTDIGVIATLDASVDGAGYVPTWTVVTRRLVIMLREERSALRRAKDAEIKRELESTRGK